ncbi:hypothetical protein GCM10007874_33000 [Labrys miyagiensis]|uniref:DUF4347 domain-containing protein n=1 Tax=Labrys miyagiensis TaxID=346912 RepID=A0ABQ6CIZ0_9HYPH|nr:DUF4347 domain-containing protein [Labrys miyagiensis]GLS20283.1 hypothetical protein GCM10007874_33000 [Labrys miyagiensis]
MSISNVTGADPVQIVFIDSRVPDIQALIDGATPGEQVFVLDAASDGIQQIADILANDNLTNLASISIVGHGAPGEIELGSSWLDDTDLAGHATALSTIGAALAPGGDLALYACNTAAGATGQQFITDLSHYAGGVDVAAATHLVGSADHGGSWTLDASTGAIEATTPFTASTLADFQGELAGTVTSQIWFGADRDTLTGNQNPFGYVNSDGSGRAQVGESPSDGSGQTTFSDIALDTAAGLYFALNQGEAATQNVHLVVGHTSGGAPISSTLTLNPNDYVIQGITADPQNHFIYIGVWGDSLADSGIIKLSYDPATGVVNNGNAIVSGGVISPSYFISTTGAAFTNPKDLYLDVAAQKIYFAANDFKTDGSGPFGGGFADTNGIYVTDLTTHVTTLLTSQSQFPTTAAGSGLAISALTINTTTGTIYFATEDQSNGPGTTHSTIWEMPIGGGTAVQMALPTSLAFVSPGGLAYDADSNQLIVSDGGDTFHTPQVAPAIHVFSLNAAGTVFTGDTILAHGDESVSSNAITRAIALDELAHIGTFTGTSTQALQGGSSPLLLLGATPTGVTDSDSGGFLASASVTISNAQAGDLIGIGSNFSFNGTPQTVNFAGGTFSVSFDASSHILTIANASGTENTYAEYEALLAQVSFKDTGTDTSTGTHPTRTVTWQVNDGAVGNPVGPNNVTTTTVTIDRAPELTADTKAALAGGSAVTGNVIGNDLDRDGDTLSVSGFTDGTAGTVGTLFHGTYGDLTLNSNGTYTYSAGATGGQQTAINNAAAGSHPTEVVTYTVSDGHGGTSSSSLTITVDRTPSTTDDTDTALNGGIAATGNVLTNDTDKDGDTLTVTGFTDGTAGTVGTVFHGTYGDITLNANGTYTYTAGATAGQQTALDNAPAGSHPTEVVTYTASDGNGGTSTSALTVTIDRAPVTVTDTNNAISGGVAATGNVLTNDTDKDGDTLTVNGFTDGTAGTVGTLFHGTYGDITLNANGTYTYAAGATVAQQTALAGASGQASEVIDYTTSDGRGGTAGSTLTIDVTGAPTITSIATSGPGIDAGGNGDLNAGHVVTLTVDMSTAVTVDTTGGIPTLTLNDGGTATYAGGSGSAALTFTYTVAAGENIGDLAVNAVELHGGTIRDTNSRDADFTGTIPAPAGTLQIDTTVPTASSVTTSGPGITAGSGDLNAGHVVTFTVNTSEAVLVDTSGGIPSLTLSNGEIATYTGGSGSAALTFSYTVVAGHDTADLAVSTVNLNSGTVKDAAGNNADLGAAVTNPTGTLQIDTTAPTVSSVTTSGLDITAGSGDLNAGHIVTFTVNTSEAVLVDTSGGIPSLTLSNGEIATYAGGSGSAALTFNYTVVAGHDTADLAVSTVNLNSGTVKDAAGNNADLGAAVTNPTGTLQIDTTVPTVTVSSDHTALTAGDTAAVTFTFSEAVAGFTLGDVVASGGSLSNLVPHGVDGSGHDIYTATFTPGATNIENGTVQVTGSYTDGANNAGAASNIVTFTGDTLAPLLSTATANPPSGVEAFGQTVQFTLTFTEAVKFVGGTPTLTLNDGGTATYDSAATATLNDPTKLVFDYTVGAGDSSTPALAITGVTHGSITDLAGNPATNVTATFPGISVEGSLITANPDSNSVFAGHTLTVNAAHGVLANDTDTNPADHLVVSTVNGSAAGVDHAIAGTYGSLTLHADGSYSYTANASSNGYVVDSFTYTPSNGHSPTSPTTLTISVVGGNYAYVQVPSGGSATTGYGNTILDGSAGHATLTASATFNAHEILIGGPGDVLNAANTGQDVFVFAGNFGHNTINNFHTKLDTIQLQQSQFGTIANVLTDLHQAGADSVLTLDSDHVVTITNMQVASLTASNFHLV